MEVRFQNFRIFSDTGFVRIAPITILVGQNSAGKTSFLAGLRFLLEASGRNWHTNPSFNKAPFMLGAYDQIAHYRGGKAGRRKFISFSVKSRITQKQISHYHRNTIEPGVATASYKFCEHSGQPQISEIEFELNDLSGTADQESVKLKTPAGNIELAWPEEVLSSFFRESESVPRLTGLVEEIHFFFSEYGPTKQKLPDETLAAIRKFSFGYELFRSTISVNTFASSPVRTEPQRNYNPVSISVTPEGSHAVMVLSRLKENDENWGKLVTRLNRFAGQAGLFENIEVKRLGKSESDPFQIVVKFGGPYSNLIDVGYGVSQALPVAIDLIREILMGKQRPDYEVRNFLYQQPEVHLHPRAQAQLGSLFVDHAMSTRNLLIVETHSDYIIDRIRSEMRRRKSFNSNDVSLLYFERDRLDSNIHQIDLTDDGRVINSPQSYREFFFGRNPP